MLLCYSHLHHHLPSYLLHLILPPLTPPQLHRPQKQRLVWHPRAAVIRPADPRARAANPCATTTSAPTAATPAVSAPPPTLTPPPHPPVIPLPNQTNTCRDSSDSDVSFVPFENNIRRHKIPHSVNCDDGDDHSDSDDDI